MLKNRKKGFTLMELIISSGLFVFVGAVVFVAMSRGSTNVHMGSFHAQASNQAAWIVTLMRRDIARSDLSRITFVADTADTWRGSGDFKVVTDNGEIEYYVEQRGNSNVFVRNEDGGRVMRLAAEHLSEISITQTDNVFDINIELVDDQQKAQNLQWSARIYVPLPSGTDQFWKPLSAN